MNSKKLEYQELIESTSKNKLFEEKDVTTPMTNTGILNRYTEKWWQRIPKRYILCLMSFLGFFNVYTMRINLSIAVVVMTDQKNGNGTESYNKFNWDTTQQGILLSSFFWGYIVTQIPGGLLAKQYGPKKFFGGGIMSTSLLTLIFPAVSHNCSFEAVVFLRVLEGFFEGVTYPAMHVLWSNWAPSLERSKLATTSASGSYVGTVVSMVLSGLIAEAFGWEAIFYCFGSIGVLWFILWSWIVTETPEEHSTIGDDELNYIISSKENYAQSMITSKIWKQIFTSAPVWAIVVAHFTSHWGLYTLITELPSYLNDFLKLDISSTGFLSALPYLITAVTIQLGGQSADFLRSKAYISTTNVRKIFNTVGCMSQAIFLLLTAYSTNKALVVVFLSMAISIGGLDYSGYYVNHLDISSTYAGVLIGISNTAGTIPGIISPTITGLLVQHKTQEEWQVVFLIAVGVYTFGSIFYVVFSSGKTQNWSME